MHINRRPLDRTQGGGDMAVAASLSTQVKRSIFSKRFTLFQIGPCIRKNCDVTLIVWYNWYNIRTQFVSWLLSVTYIDTSVVKRTCRFLSKQNKLQTIVMGRHNYHQLAWGLCFEGNMSISPSSLPRRRYIRVSAFFIGRMTAKYMIIPKRSIAATPRHANNVLSMHDGDVMRVTCPRSDECGDSSDVIDPLTFDECEVS